MSKLKFGFEVFSINRHQHSTSSDPNRLKVCVPPSSRGGSGGDEDADLDNIEYADERATSTDVMSIDNSGAASDRDKIDPLDAFMEGLQEEMKAAPPPKAKEKLDKYKDDVEDDPVEIFVKSKKDLGLQLAVNAMQAGYNSDEEVYAAAKALDVRMIDYNSNDNLIVLDKKKIEQHSSIDYELFDKDFYEAKPSILGMSEQNVAEYRNSLDIHISGFDVLRPIKAFEDCGFSVELMKAIGKQAYEKPTPMQCQALPIVLPMK